MDVASCVRDAVSWVRDIAIWVRDVAFWVRDVASWVGTCDGHPCLVILPIFRKMSCAISSRILVKICGLLVCFAILSLLSFFKGLRSLLLAESC